MNYNKEEFADPRRFMPERWISDDAAYLKRLDEVHSTFSNGSRSCIGRNLALAEIYITIAHFVRKFKPEYPVQADLDIKEVFGVVMNKPVKIAFREADS